jgi:Tfp pilus assembly protein FimT
MKRKRTGFSMLELVLIAVFLGIFAVIAVPRLNYAAIAKQKADSTAKKIVADLRLTRSLAISGAANNPDGFQLHMVGLNPYTGYKIENRETEEVVASHTIDSDVTCSGDNRFRFGPLGNLSDTNNTHLTVSAEGKTFTINIIPATGIVKCNEN